MSVVELARLDKVAKRHRSKTARVENGDRIAIDLITIAKVKIRKNVSFGIRHASVAWAGDMNVEAEQSDDWLSTDETHGATANAEGKETSREALGRRKSFGPVRRVGVIRTKPVKEHSTHRRRSEGADHGRTCGARPVRNAVADAPDPASHGSRRSQVQGHPG